MATRLEIHNNQKDFYVNNRITDFLPLIGEGDKANIVEEVGNYTWGSSIIKHTDGLYYSFMVKWDDVDGIDGFVHYARIEVSNGATDPAGPFTGYTELTELKGQAWCDEAVWGVKVIYHNNLYHLFFVGTTYDTISYPGLNSEARANSRIGLATSAHPQGPYTLEPTNPILEPREAPNWDQNRVTNHTIWRDKNGKWRMTYKADLDGVLGEARLGMVESDDLINWTGREDSPNFGVNLPTDFEPEDPEVWQEGDKWYAIVVDVTGEVVTSRDGVFMISNNGIHFYIADNELAWNGNVDWTDETSDSYTREERPFILVENGEATHYSAIFLGEANNSFNITRPLIRN